MLTYLTNERDQRYLVAILLMLASSILVAVTSAIGKELVLTLALPLVLLLRYLFPALLIWGVAAVKRIPRYQRRYTGLYIVRVVLGVLSQYALFYYLIYGNILEATLLFMTSPLFVPLILRAIDKTPIYRKQWFSIIVGFIGVALVLQPTQDIINWPLFIGIASGLLNAGSQICYHKLVKKTDVNSANFYIYTFSTVLTFIPILIFFHVTFAAVAITNLHTIITTVLLFLGLAIVSIGVKIFRGKAYTKVNKTSSLTPFLYTAILFAGLLDWLVYGIVPDYLAVIGALLIVSSGLILYIIKPKGVKS